MLHKSLMTFSPIPPSLFLHFSPFLPSVLKYVLSTRHAPDVLIGVLRDKQRRALSARGLKSTGPRGDASTMTTRQVWRGNSTREAQIKYYGTVACCLCNAYCAIQNHQAVGFYFSLPLTFIPGGCSSTPGYRLGQIHDLDKHFQ